MQPRLLLPRSLLLLLSLTPGEEVVMLRSLMFHAPLAALLGFAGCVGEAPEDVDRTEDPEAHAEGVGDDSQALGEPIFASLVVENGVPVTGLAGATGSMATYTFSVPAGATNLKFVTSG